MVRKRRWIQHAPHTDDPIIYHPEIGPIQDNHKQLGQIAGINPRATHTRLQHLIEVAGNTELSLQHLKRKGREIGSFNDISTGGKCHDGHAPFSHVVEYVIEDFTGVNHEDHMVHVITGNAEMLGRLPFRDDEGRTLEDVIISLNSDPLNVCKLVSGEDRACEIFSHKVLGMDKITYTHTDARILRWTREPCRIEDMIGIQTYVNGTGLGIDIEVAEHFIHHPITMTCDQQNMYYWMYTEAYLSTVGIICGRHIQKAAQFGIEGNVFTPQQIWDLPDAVFLDRILQAPQNGSEETSEIRKKAKYHADRYQSKRPYVSAVALKYEEHKELRSKHEAVEILDREIVSRFLAAVKKPRNLTKLEEKLSLDLGCDIIVAVMPDPKKLEPVDVPIYCGVRYVGQLSQFAKGHFQNLLDQRDRFFAIRIACDSKYQDMLSDKSEHVKDCFMKRAYEIIEEYEATRNTQVVAIPA